jgi:hypothetical protein
MPGLMNNAGVRKNRSASFRFGSFGVYCSGGVSDLAVGPNFALVLHVGLSRLIIFWRL